MSGVTERCWDCGSEDDSSTVVKYGLIEGVASVEGVCKALCSVDTVCSDDSENADNNVWYRDTNTDGIESVENAINCLVNDDNVNGIAGLTSFLKWRVIFKMQSAPLQLMVTI